MCSTNHDMHIKKRAPPQPCLSHAGWRMETSLCLVESKISLVTVEANKIYNEYNKEEDQQITFYIQ